MQDLTKFKSMHRFYVEAWMNERIQSINFDLFELMHMQLLHNPSLDTIFRASRRDVTNLKANRNALVNLLNTPFSTLTLTVTEEADWEALIHGSALTSAVKKLQDQLPSLDATSRYAIGEANKRYLDLVTSLIHMNVLAAPMLGISTELAKLLVSATTHQLHIAMQRIPGVPLFRFRFSNPSFWYEFTTNYISEEAIAHQLMLTTAPLINVPYPKVWQDDFRLNKSLGDTYSDAMMAYGCRASTTASLFRLAPNYTRARYMLIHGKPSACGNKPISLSWFVDSPIKRLHSSVFSWLYRCSLAGGANVPEAIIASSDLYNSLFGKRAIITPDRACLLTRSMSADNRLTSIPCRHCGTYYIASNSDTRIEMHSSFQCPGCQLKLVERSSKKRKSRFSK